MVAYSLYLIGVLIAILIAMIVNKLEKQKEPQNTLLIELPEYKSPNARTIAIYVWEKVKDYLTKAGTTIFIKWLLKLLLNRENTPPLWHIFQKTYQQIKHK